MSVRLSTTDAQLKTTLSAALTIGASHFVTAMWVRLVSDRNTDCLMWALLDVDPDATTVLRAFTDTDGTSVYVDSSGGGIGGYSLTTATWYYIVYDRYDNAGSETTRLRIFDDTSSTTPVFGPTSNGADTTSYTTMDTVVIGDINPTARVACDMEVAALKIHTGVAAGWSDAECRTESQYFAIQKAGGTETFSWRLETATADTQGYNEMDGTGGNFSVIAGTVATGATRPGQLEAAASVTLDQEGFRWYEDDGSESGSSASAAQDTSITAAAGSTKRLRVIVNATGDPPTTAYKLQWRISGGSWADVA